MSTRKRELTAVDIAKDVIALVKAKKLRVAKGSYGLFGEVFYTKHAGQSFQRLLQNPKVKDVCDVCAIGAVFCAFVDKRNQIKVNYDTFGDDEAMISMLSGFFSEPQLRLMECAFELWSRRSEYFTGREQYVRAAYQFGMRYSDNPTKRLIAIMENVIANKGKFNPQLTLDPLD